MIKYILFLLVGYVLALAQINIEAEYNGSATVFDKVLIDSNEF